VKPERIEWAKVHDLRHAMKARRARVTLMLSTVPRTGVHTVPSISWYLYTCWAQEKAAVLRPDQIFFSTMCELSNVVVDNADAFRHLFTSTAKGSPKDTVRALTMDPCSVDPESLVAALSDQIANKRVLETITDTSAFPSAPKGYATAIAASMLKMASPYFSYVSYCCGLPAIIVEGEDSEWAALDVKLAALQEEVGSVAFKLHEWSHETTTLDGFFARVRRVVAGIRRHGFDADGVDDEERSAWVSGCFGIRANCGSGHPYELSGWFRDLFVNPDANMAQQANHTAYFAWRNEETRRMFYEMHGCFVAEPREVDDAATGLKVKCLYPSYGHYKYEIHDEAFFKRVARD